MSANTFVTPEIRREARKLIAGFAGIVVSATGVTTAVAAARDLDGFAFSGASRVDLQTAPAGIDVLGEHGSKAAAAQLVDPTLAEGLHPGKSAFFGYTLGLTEDSATAASVTMDALAAAGQAEGLTYEARTVADATQCRVLWARGSQVVATRPFVAPASESFVVARDATLARPLQLCIRVSLAPDAGRIHTGSVTWRFVAVPAQ